MIKKAEKTELGKQNSELRNQKQNSKDRKQSSENRRRKNMRKRLVATIAAGAAAVLMLSGFDSAMTVQGLTEKSKSAMAQVSSLKADLQGNASMNLNISQGGEGGATMDIPINGMFGLNMQLNLDPLQMMVEMEYKGEAMGQGADAKMSMYVLEKEDGSADAYLGTYSSSETTVMQWNAETADAQQVGQLKEAVKAMLSGDFAAISSLADTGASVDPAAAAQVAANYQDQILSMTALSPQSVMVNGKECYQLTADVSGSDLLPLMTEVMAASGEMTDDMSLQVMETVLSGIRIHMESDIDVQTYLPVYAVMDLGGSDFSAVGNMIVGSMMGGSTDGSASAAININELKASGTFDGNSPVQITVPEEAKAAAVNVGTDIDSIDSIGGLLTGGTDVGGLLTNDTDGGIEGLDDAEDGPIQNPDGTYTIRYENYAGDVKEAVIATPEGLRLSYGSENYLSFADDNYSITVSYSLYSKDTPQESVEDDLDVSYMEGNSDYSEVTRTQVMQTALPDGTPVYYGSKAYKYNNYRIGGTCCAIQAGDYVVDFEIDRDDENYNFVEASEQDVITYAGYVRPAA